MMTVVRHLPPDEARLIDLYRQAKAWAGYVPDAPLQNVEHDLQRAMTQWVLARARESELRRRRGGR